MNGCTSGQKVAVNVGGTYEGNAGQCRGMGIGSSRIRHCDCDHHLRPTTLIDPCLTAFANGCLSDMPSDTSCCPGADASYNPVTRSYENGGTCIANSVRLSLTVTANELIALMATNQTAIAELDAIQTCPSSRFYGCQDALCCMLKEVRRCDVASPPADCATSDEWVIYGEFAPAAVATAVPTTVVAAQAAASDSSIPPGLIVAIVVAVIAIVAVIGIVIVLNKKGKMDPTITAKSVGATEVQMRQQAGSSTTDSKI